MRRALIALALAALLSAGLVACGKKGPLEPPPGESESANQAQ